MRLGCWSLLALGIAAAACAGTIGPVIPSVQVLVVLDSLDDTLRIIPVDSPGVVHRVALQSGAFSKHALALRGQFAAIGLGRNALSYDLAARRTICQTVILDPSSLTGLINSLAFTDDGSQVLAAITSTNITGEFLPGNCNSGAVLVRSPVAFVSARSTFFTIAGKPPACDPLPALCPELPSWLSTPADSIPLSLPGNAQGGVLASDGLLYVINAGRGRLANARLSQVDPVSKIEQSVYNGFGTLPQYITTDGDRVFVASALEGLMVYNTRTRLVERSASSPIALFGSPRGLAADDVGRVYALIAGGCTSTGAPGSVQLFGADLVSKHGPNLGRCPVAIGVTDIPSTLYRFDD